MRSTTRSWTLTLMTTLLFACGGGSSADPAHEGESEAESEGDNPGEGEAESEGEPDPSFMRATFQYEGWSDELYFDNILIDQGGTCPRNAERPGEEPSCVVCTNEGIHAQRYTGPGGGCNIGVPGLQVDPLKDFTGPGTYTLSECAVQGCACFADPTDSQYPGHFFSGTTLTGNSAEGTITVERASVPNLFSIHFEIEGLRYCEEPGSCGDYPYSGRMSGEVLCAME